MARSRRVVDALLHAGQAHAAHGNSDAAVALLTLAATVSRRRHSGAFTNQALESHLRTVSEGFAAAWDPPQASAAGTPNDSEDRVLHVLTRGYAAGGHTRLVERWIEGEPGVAASVVFTDGDSDVPVRTRDVAESSGGTVHRLRGSTADRARQLHALAWTTGRIVLSIHENDVVPQLAFAGMRRRPPVVVVNHSEHVFWTGASLADVVVSLRPASTDLAVRRRGLSPARCVEVPLPVSSRRRQQSADGARRALGIEPTQRVLLTVGWRYKFTPYAGDDLIAALGPILDEPDVHLIAVGPRDDDELWSAARARYGGRVHAVGRQDDVQPYLDAADVLVDSYPVASLTAALEAAMCGLPVVGLAPRDAGWPRILREDDGALIDAMFDDVDAYRDCIRTLLRDRAAWHSASRTQQQLVLRAHGPDAWEWAMQRVGRAVASADLDRHRPRRRERLGTTGAEDAILAGYIADCEDRLVRPELRWRREDSGCDDASLHPLIAGIERIDELLLGRAAPGREEYDDALRIARDAMPVRPFSRAVGRAFARRLRALRG
jgi:glycosyltransferase involved in cell wall biosynthesis